MIKIAVIGFGVVGSGVVEILDTNKAVLEVSAGQSVEIDKILDIREFPGNPYEHLVTHIAEEVFDNPEISIIVETMGGTGIAYEFSKRALNNKKHLITSNKEMVAKHGPELLQLAEQNGVRYLFEASVGGGIPIIRPMTLCLGANRIDEVMGILNGTTNYILTKMKDTGMEFDEALKRAQAKGYAEANPAADIEGHDACRKIAILSSLAYDEYVNYNDLYCEGITGITSDDIRFADKLGRVIKLVGYSRKDENGVFARVSPAMLSHNHSLANVNGVFNAIMVRGDYIGDTMFYGKGAGKKATASAVVGDIIDVVKNPKARPKADWSKNVEKMVPVDESYSSFFVRYKASSGYENAKNGLDSVFQGLEHVAVVNSEVAGIYGFVTREMKEGDFRARLKDIKGVSEVLSVIRLI